MGGKRVSSKDVARAAGVSQATVSYVLNDTPGIKIKPETRRAVTDAAERLNYHANRMARNMRLSRASSVGLVTDKDISSNMFMTALEGVKSVLLARQYSITMCLSPHEGVSGAEYISYYHSNLIDGVIFLFTSIGEEEERYLLRNNIPYVMINAHTDAVAHFQVRTNIENAIDAAVERFLALGAKEIGFIGNAAGKGNSQRFSAFQASLSRRGVNQRRGLSRHISGTDDELATGIARYFDDIRRPPDAIFCDQVTTAFLTLRYAAAHGIAVPADMALVAIGTSQFSARAYPALSAIEAPLYNMGRQGCQLLFDILDEMEGIGTGGTREVITLEWDFCERETTKG